MPTAGYTRADARLPHLDGVVDHLERHPWGRDLDHGNVVACRFEALLVGHARRQIAQLAVLGDLNARLGNGLQYETHTHPQLRG